MTEGLKPANTTGATNSIKVINGEPCPTCGGCVFTATLFHGDLVTTCDACGTEVPYA